MTGINADIIRLVIPFEGAVREAYSGCHILVKTESSRDIPEIIKDCGNKGIDLLGIILDYRSYSLDLVAFDDPPPQIPVFILVRNIGSLKLLAENLAQLRSPKFQVFLDTALPESYTDLRILASLGIRTGLINLQGNILWEKLIGLGTYYRRSHHHLELMEPISQIFRSNGHPLDPFSFEPLINNPTYCIHLDASANIAMSLADLKEGRFIGNGVEFAKKIKEQNVYKNLFTIRERFFTELNTCSVCSHWRKCFGHFHENEDKENTCQRFFAIFD